MDWEALRTFAVVCRANTMSAAARELGVNQTTIARRIARLEEATGFPVLLRRAGQMRPTLRAQSLLKTARAMEAEVSTLLEANGTLSEKVARPEISGVVRVAGVDVIFENCIAPRLGELTSNHPSLCVELIGGNRNLSLPQRETDIALRLARPQTGAFHIRKIGVMEYGIYGPDGINDPTDAPWVDLDDAFADKPEQIWLNRHFPNRQTISRSNRGAIMATMACSANAFALLPRCLGDRAPGLTRKPDIEPEGREIWLLIHQDMRHVPRVRVVAEWVSDVLIGSAAIKSV